MNIEKAIEILKEQYTTVSKCLSIKEATEQNTAINLAISVLEKQMARSPVNRCATFLIAECPRCNGTVSFHHKHCHWCGQNLDWEVENE